MNIKLSDSFGYSKLIRFTIPSILMMIIISVYGVIDGLFVSNFVGKSAFTSLNLIYPFIMIFGAFGFMLGTGGTALVGKYLGEGEDKLARETFSMLIFVIALGGLFFAILGVTFIEPVSLLLGATPELLEDCIVYGAIMLMALPAFMLQTSFQIFVVVANKPHMGMVLAIISGITNIILDYILIVLCHWGIAGAAIATVSSQIIGAIIPLLYFLRKNNSSNLYLGKFSFRPKDLGKSASNGASEMMTNISMSLVNILYNLQLMDYIGDNGVSAFGIIMYTSLIFQGVFIGYSIGIAPVVSYHYGAENRGEVQSLLEKSMKLLLLSATILTGLATFFAPQLAKIFVSYDAELLALSTHALRLYATAYLFSAVNIFASAFFTALNNGKISALISFLRTLLFQAMMIMLLPLIFGIDGIWLAVLFAEIMCLVVTVIAFVKNNKNYHYFGEKTSP